MTTKKIHIGNLDLSTSQKFDDSENPIIYCQIYLPEKRKSKINNQYIKMITKNMFLAALLLMIGFIIACDKNMDKPNLKNEQVEKNMEEIKKNLEAGLTASKENPFSFRKFDPYLNGKWIGNAISYGCYREGQAPGAKGPTKEQILEDLNILSEHWNLIRVYNADDDAQRVLEVIRENNLHIKMMLGVWLENETKHPEYKNANIKNILRSIQLANRFKDIVIAVNVGNEAQVFWSWHRMDLKNQIRYVRAVRNNVSAPVTMADDYNFWNKPEGKKVSAELDFIVTHIYPLWNGKTLETAIPWMDSTYKDLQKRYPEKQIVLGETGWATTYNTEKKGDGEQGTLIKGDVGLAAQEKYLIKHNEWVNKNKVTTFLFEAFDEPWKGGGANSGPNEIEKHWGVFYENRTPKIRLFELEPQE